jgi:hypothetical protein
MDPAPSGRQPTDGGRAPVHSALKIREFEDFMRNPPLHDVNAAYEIRFPSLFRPGQALAFPCDREGHVDLDALSDRAKGNYLFARAMVGREYATPCVQVRDLH